MRDACLKVVRVCLNSMVASEPTAKRLWKGKYSTVGIKEELSIRIYFEKKMADFFAMLFFLQWLYYFSKSKVTLMASQYWIGWPLDSCTKTEKRITDQSLVYLYFLSECGTEAICGDDEEVRLYL